MTTQSPQSPHSPVPEWAERLLRARGPHGFLTRLLGAWLSRFLAVQGFDRAVAIGAQAFTALFPLLVIVAALRGSGDESLGEELIELLGLRGDAAVSAQQALAPISGVEDSASAVGGVLLLASVLSLSRAVQRLYEHALGLRPLGLRSTGYGLLWLLTVVIGIVIGDAAYDASEGVVRLAISLSIATVIALLTPYLLLMRRVGWRSLLASALMTAVGVLVFASLSSAWMSQTVEQWASRFGVIGVAFALLSWVTGAAFVLVIGVCGGAVIGELRDGRDEIADRLLDELRAKQAFRATD